MISRIIDITDQFNSTGRARLDLGGWGIATFQIISPSGSISFTGTNDGGEETGTLTPSPSRSINFSTIEATDLSSGTKVTSTSATGMYEVVIDCKYIQLFGTGVTATKILVFVNKPALAL
jgi:hypothetical protein